MAEEIGALAPRGADGKLHTIAGVEKVKSIPEWLSACEITDRGRIFLDNLSIDFHVGHIGPRLLAKFITDLKVWLVGPSPALQPGEERCSKAVMDTIRNSKLYFNGHQINLTPVPMICVFRLDEFIMNTWFDFTALGGLQDIASPEDFFNILHGIGDLSSILRADVDPHLRGGFPMVWLTRESELASALAPCAGLLGIPSKADVARDSLGLLHYAHDEFLCSITLNVGDVDWNQLRRPCAFDGGMNLVYRSNEEIEPEGRAIHLESHKPVLAELVSCPVPLRSHHIPTALGRITCAPGFSWATLANSVKDARVKEIARVVVKI